MKFQNKVVHGIYNAKIQDFPIIIVMKLKIVKIAILQIVPFNVLIWVCAHHTNHIVKAFIVINVFKIPTVPLMNGASIKNALINVHLMPCAN